MPVIQERGESTKIDAPTSHTEAKSRLQIISSSIHGLQLQTGPDATATASIMSDTALHATVAIDTSTWLVCCSQLLCAAVLGIYLEYPAVTAPWGWHSGLTAHRPPPGSPWGRWTQYIQNKT